MGQLLSNTILESCGSVFLAYKVAISYETVRTHTLWLDVH